LLFLLFITNIGVSQNQAYLYKEFLPKSVVHNNEFMKMISQNIMKLGPIHPDLIYFYLEGLRYKTDNSIDNKTRSMVLTELQKIRTNYILKRNDWAQSQINILNNAKVNRKTLEEAKKYFKKLITENIVAYRSSGTTRENDNKVQKLEKEIPESRANSQDVTNEYKVLIDSNLVDCFAVIYYNSRGNKNYDSYSNNKYQKIVLEKEIIQNYKEALENSDLNIDNFLSYWYLYQGGLNGYNEISAADYVREIISSKNRNALHSGISFGTYYSTFLISPSIEDEIYISGMNDNVKIKEYSAKSQLGLFCDYSFKIKQELEPFSVLKIQVGLSRSTEPQKIDFSSGFLQEKYIVAGTKVYRKLEFYTHELNIQSLSTYMTKISSPVYILNNSLYLEAGLLFEYLQYKYELSYDYHFLYQISYPTVIGVWITKTMANVRDGDFNVSKKYDKFIVYPILGIRYRPMQHVFMYVGSIPSNVSIEISYNF